MTIPDAIAVERAEAAACGDYFLAVPRALREALRVSVHDVAGALVLVTGAIDLPWFNRTLGLGVEEPATEAQVDRVIALCEAGGAKRWVIELSPSAQPAELPAWLRARGLAPVGPTAKVLRGAEPVVAPAGQLTVVRESDPEAFARISCAGFDMPDMMRPWNAALVGRRGWQTYLALEDGEPLSCGVLYLGAPEAAWLGMGATVREKRRRGGQGALMARRLADAIAAGCGRVVSDTAPGMENPSYRNMMRAGFEVVHLRESWMRTSQVATQEATGRAILASMEPLTIVRLWAAAAWADGVLHPSEEAALRRLIEASEELGVEGRQQALALLAAPPAVSVEEVGKLDAHAREGVYRAALGIVRLDGKVTSDEEAWVGRLRERLGLDKETLARIEKEAR